VGDEAHHAMKTGDIATFRVRHGHVSKDNNPDGVRVNGGSWESTVVTVDPEIADPVVIQARLHEAFQRFIVGITLERVAEQKKRLQQMKAS